MGRLSKLILLVILLCFSPRFASAQAVASFVVNDTCLLSRVQFINISNSPGQNIVSYLWNFGDLASGANNSSTQQNPFHTFSDTGTYIVSLDVTDDASNTASFSRQVTIKPSPRADFTVANVCDGDLVQFNNTSSSDAAGFLVSYIWDFGDNTSSGQISPSRIYDGPGSYPVQLTIYASNGCADTALHVVKVNAFPNVQISSDLSACPGLPFSISDLSTVFNGFVSERLWTIDGSAGDTGQVATHTFATAGNYTAHLLVISDGGCRDSIDTVIVVAAKPVAAFSHTLSIGEAPLTVQFSNTSSGASVYAWNFGNATLSALENPSVIYSDTGHYSITLIATNTAGCSDTAYSDAYVLKPRFDLALTDLMLSNSGSLYTIGIRLANNSNVPVFGFIMKADFGGDARLLETRMDTLMPGVEKTFYFNGQYDYNTALGDAFFCAEVATLKGLTENDLANNKQCRLLGGDFYVSEPYPNPASNQVTFGLILPEAGEVALQIFDVKGVVVYNQTASTFQSGLTNFRLDVTSLRHGVYCCTLRYRDRMVVKRFVR